MISWTLFWQIIILLFVLTFLIHMIIGKVGDERVRIITTKHRLDMGEDPSEKGGSTVYKSP